MERHRALIKRVLERLFPALGPQYWWPAASPFEPCRYLTPNGCWLERIARPYVCVWYLCEAQMDVFGEESSAMQRRFIWALECMRACRLRLEALYEAAFPEPCHFEKNLISTTGATPAQGESLTVF